MKPIINKPSIHRKKLPNDPIDLKDNSIELNENKLNNFITDGKNSIAKFFEKKSQRYQKLLKIKRNIEIERNKEDSIVKEARIKEDYLAKEKRAIQDINLEKEIAISKYEEALELYSLNKKLKLKGTERLRLVEIISLNENDDVELDIIK